MEKLAILNLMFCFSKQMIKIVKKIGMGHGRRSKGDETDEHQVLTYFKENTSKKLVRFTLFNKIICNYRKMELYGTVTIKMHLKSAFSMT